MSQNILSIAGTVAIVTGSTRGIGEAVAKRLAEAGASVVVSGRTESDGTEVVDSITSAGGTAKFIQTDMRTPDDIQALIETTVAEFGGLDILVNNAGFETDTAPDEVDIETWDAIIDTDLRAYWLAAKYAYPYLVESDYAAVVNVSSNHSLQTQPKKFPYNVVKAGIDNMTQSMAVAWGIDGIRVNSVNPGWTKVERITESLTDEELAYLDRVHPLGRIGNPEDVGNAVLYLVSELSGFVTGESLVVDGGRTSVLQDDLYLNDHGLSLDD
ncbi:SDR family NAD(P)-dependent oxidoreductase [Halorubrum pallidum]|uniref:SDR family NAD(P)-dependent oxidoreductase n=1 Tax=Halorubrum pallidum TaxID=1526114 RepID=A0ABD5T9K8_9EURY